MTPPIPPIKPTAGTATAQATHSEATVCTAAEMSPERLFWYAESMAQSISAAVTVNRLLNGVCRLSPAIAVICPITFSKLSFESEFASAASTPSALSRSSTSSDKPLYTPE